MTLSKKYKPGSRQNFSFQNSLLYKRAQCCGALPWLPLTCENFPIIPVAPSGYICYGPPTGDVPPDPADNDITITLGNSGPGQITGNNYELYFGPTLINSWVNQGPTVTHTFTNYDFSSQNGTYTLIITNFIGCVNRFDFELLGVPRPVIDINVNASPSGVCLGCVDSGSALRLDIVTPFPGADYIHSLKGLDTNFCTYSSGLVGPTYDAIDICSDRYGIGTELVIGGEVVCLYYVTYTFNP